MHELQPFTRHTFAFHTNTCKRALLLVPKNAFWYCEKNSNDQKATEKWYYSRYGYVDSANPVCVRSNLILLLKWKISGFNAPEWRTFFCCTFLHDKISFYGCLFFHSVVFVRALFFVLLNEFVCHLIWANKLRVFMCRELNAVLLFIY